MAENEEKKEEQAENEEKIHWLQRLMDNPWALLFWGLVIPTLSYTVWGLVELLTLSKATLP